MYNNDHKDQIEENLPNILGYIAIMDITKSTAILSRGLSFCYYFPSNISVNVQDIISATCPYCHLGLFT
jgi:hypothetical protein